MLTVGIRIVADCVALSCQVTRKLKRATTLEFTTVSAIIFIHCYHPLFIHNCFSNSERLDGLGASLLTILPCLSMIK